METKDLDVIIDLMKDLQEKMQYGEDDFSERLGRKKPDMEIAKVSVEPDMEPDSMDPMEDMEMEEEDPDEKFKNRLMKMRG